MLKIIMYTITALYCIGIIYHYGIRQSKQYKKKIGLMKLDKEYKDFEDFIREVD